MRGNSDRFCSLVPLQRSHNPHVSSNFFFNKRNDTEILVVYCLTFQNVLTFLSWKDCLVVSKGGLLQVQGSCLFHFFFVSVIIYASRIPFRRLSSIILIRTGQSSHGDSVHKTRYDVGLSSSGMEFCRASIVEAERTILLRQNKHPA